MTKISSKMFKIGVIILFLVLLLALAFLFYTRSEGGFLQNVRSSPAPTTMPEDELVKISPQPSSAIEAGQELRILFDPEEISLSIGEQTTVEVQLSADPAKQTTISAYDLVISYDPTIIQASNLNKGNLLVNGVILDSEIDEDLGRLTFSVGEQLGESSSDAAGGKLVSFEIRALGERSVPVVISLSSSSTFVDSNKEELRYTGNTLVVNTTAQDEN